jgi:hypothetical protein
MRSIIAMRLAMVKSWAWTIGAPPRVDILCSAGIDAGMLASIDVVALRR